VRRLPFSSLANESLDRLIRRRNLIWAIAWPGLICVFAAFGSAAFILDSEFLLGAAYVVFGAGFLVAGSGGAFYQSRILRSRFEKWRLDDFADLTRLMKKTMPTLFATSLFFLELSSVWRNLPESTAVLRLLGTAVSGGALLWVGMAFAAREAAKDRGMQRVFRLPLAQARNRLEALAREGKGSLGRLVRYPIVRFPIRVDFSTANGVIRLQRFGSGATVVKVLHSTDWARLASMWEKSVSDTSSPGREPPTP